jgi:hypothetical protein
MIAVRSRREMDAALEIELIDMPGAAPCRPGGWHTATGERTTAGREMNDVAATMACGPILRCIADASLSPSTG